MDRPEQSSLITTGSDQRHMCAFDQSGSLASGIPIDSLPNEILEFIFKLYQLVDLGDPCCILQALRLSQVSRRWRDVAIHFSTLWTQLSFSDSDTMYHLASTLIDRSNRRLLDITLINKRDGDLSENMLPLMESLVAHIHRWRRFTISATSTRQMSPLMKIISDASALHLEALIFRPQYENGLVIEDMPIFQQGAPCLSYLEIEQCIPMLPPLPGLTHIQLSCLDIEYEQAHLVEELLRQSPCLERLDVNRTRSFAEGNIHLPMLHSLRITNMEALDAINLLQWISAPALKSMTLSDALRFENIAPEGLQDDLAECRPYPALRVFEYYGGDLEQVVGIDFLRGMPLVERVTFHGSDADFLIQLKGDRSMWPELQNHSVTVCSPEAMYGLTASRL